MNSDKWILKVEAWRAAQDTRAALRQAEAEVGVGTKYIIALKKAKDSACHTLGSAYLCLSRQRMGLPHFCEKKEQFSTNSSPTRLAGICREQ